MQKGWVAEPWLATYVLGRGASSLINRASFCSFSIGNLVVGGVLSRAPSSFQATLSYDVVVPPFNVGSFHREDPRTRQQDTDDPLTPFAPWMPKGALLDKRSPPLRPSSSVVGPTPGSETSLSGSCT